MRRTALSLGLLALATPAVAQVSRFDVTEDVPAFAGRSFGHVGADRRVSRHRRSCIRSAQARRQDRHPLQGTMLPFADTEAERRANGDPRPSIAERYGDDAGDQNALDRGAAGLMAERLLLEQDAPAGR